MWSVCIYGNSLFLFLFMCPFKANVHCVWQQGFVCDVVCQMLNGIRQYRHTQTFVALGLWQWLWSHLTYSMQRLKCKKLVSHFLSHYSYHVLFPWNCLSSFNFYFGMQSHFISNIQHRLVVELVDQACFYAWIHVLHLRFTLKHFVLCLLCHIWL